MKKKGHTIIARGVDEETYRTLWQMRRAFGCRSWAELLRLIAEQFREEVEELWP